MPDEIQPALTPEEWEEKCARTPNGTLRYSLATDTDDAIRDTDGGTVAYRDDLPSLIALANAALPDDDPRKITWDDWKGISAAIGQLLHVTAGQDEGSWWIERLRGTAAKLAALLPPEE